MKNLISCLLFLIVFNGFTQCPIKERKEQEKEQQINNSYDILESYDDLEEESDTLAEKADSLYLIWKEKLHKLQKSKEPE